jgi:hypothetical protein
MLKKSFVDNGKMEDEELGRCEFMEAGCGIKLNMFGIISVLSVNRFIFSLLLSSLKRKRRVLFVTV